MPVMDWDKLKIFYSTAEAGSFTRAGELLQMNQSSISRQVNALEEQLQTTLFQRHARGLQLTEQGKLLFQTVSEMQDRLVAAETLINDTKEKPFGPLKISAPIGFGSLWLVPRLHDFIGRYPDIDPEIQLVDEELDLSTGETEVAIRLREPQQSGLIRKRLCTVHFHIYASAAYLKRKGTPRNIEDLDNHDILLLGLSAPPHFMAANWMETAGREEGSHRKPVLRTNGVYAQKQAVKAGIGLAALPDYMVREEGDIIPVMRNIELPNLDVFYVYPEEHRNSKRIDVLRDFLLAKTRHWKD